MIVGSRFAGFLLNKTDELADLNRRNNLDIKEVTEIYLLDEIRDDEICLPDCILFHQGCHFHKKEGALSFTLSPTCYCSVMLLPKTPF